ncbi:hypothetical protein F2Q68_00038387 [Brassica cretica]|uniref:Peptidase S26 domain-containing protein n=2 Tax=Brassica cretica TaxID=69181 RepID=A0ABQ7AM76_BRACR|nr:hypothetical protein F2Q68_00038387 [Brassica cretica]KAF3498743.1 hypothetical protein DY000_02051980 [Brassica cretica]
MAYISNWVRYMVHKLEYSLTLGLKVSLSLSLALCLPWLWLQAGNHTQGRVIDREFISVVMKNLLYGRITYLHSVKGEGMAPTMGSHDNTLLVRKLPDVDTRVRFLRPSGCLVFCLSGYVSVGDAVVLKDPNETLKYLVRRLAALQGSEMVSSDEKDKPFVLKKDQCWVFAENKEMKSKEAYDSRSFGPVSLADIIGRAIYCMRTAVDHGPVSNSEFFMQEDSPILAVELDVDELAKDHKACHWSRYVCGKMLSKRHALSDNDLNSDLITALLTDRFADMTNAEFKARSIGLNTSSLRFNRDERPVCDASYSVTWTSKKDTVERHDEPEDELQAEPEIVSKYEEHESDFDSEHGHVTAILEPESELQLDSYEEEEEDVTLDVLLDDDESLDEEVDGAEEEEDLSTLKLMERKGIAKSRGTVI